MTDRLTMIKIAAQRAEAKSRGITFEEVEMQHVIKDLDNRKAEVKAELKAAAKAEKKLHKELTDEEQWKAGIQSPNSLEMDSPENMFYSDKDTKDYIENSSYFENYLATKDKDWD